MTVYIPPYPSEKNSSPMPTGTIPTGSKFKGEPLAPVPHIMDSAGISRFAQTEQLPKIQHSQSTQRPSEINDIEPDTVRAKAPKPEMGFFEKVMDFFKSLFS